MIKRRKKGISVLVPTQNSQKTVKLCIESFLEFGDEIIVVDNGSRDETINIVTTIAQQCEKIKFFNAPDLVDLYQNRQYAFERSQYNWIARIDSDYVAYTSGPQDIKELRQLIINARPSIRPIAYGIKQVNLYRDYWHTGIEREQRHNNSGPHVASPVVSLPARIIQYFPGMKFARLGRWEGVRFQRFLQHRHLDEPYWFHCEFKSDLDYFYRSERTNWRQLGDYRRFPTLRSYIEHILPDKYGTNNIDEACRNYIEKHLNRFLMTYEPLRYYSYPEIIKEEMEKCT